MVLNKLWWMDSYDEVRWQIQTLWSMASSNHTLWLLRKLNIDLIYSYKSLHSPGHDTRFFSDVSRTSEPGFNTMKEGNCSSRTQINLHTCSLTVVMYLSKQLWYFSMCWFGLQHFRGSWGWMPEFNMVNQYDYI